MRFIFSTILLAVMISSTLVTWGDTFIGEIEKIELSELLDGEAEDGEIEAEKKVDDKLKYASRNSINKMDPYHNNAWSEQGLFHNRFREIVTPPPEFI